MIIEVASTAAMIALGERIGRLLSGGEVIELVGDIGAGKTTFTKGLGKGMDVTEVIHSPTFTINCMYDARDGLRLAHYDFYRLHDPGVMAAELEETIHDTNTITVIEWGEVVANVVPESRTKIEIIAPSEEVRSVTITGALERAMGKIS